jgi:hypothetical protein
VLQVPKSPEERMRASQQEEQPAKDGLLRLRVAILQWLRRLNSSPI